MWVFAWIAVGVVLGLLTRAVLPHSGLGGWAGDVTLGILGAVFGGWLVYSDSIAHTLIDFPLWSTAFASATAVGLLVVVHMLTQEGPRTEEEPD